jgi:hypothetical protein
VNILERINVSYSDFNCFLYVFLIFMGNGICYSEVYNFDKYVYLHILFHWDFVRILGFWLFEKSA